MAYFFDPNSYANTLFGGPSLFTRRRPSPPPATYYPHETRDPYIRALAEEQTARAQLQEAIKKEREARQRREKEEARAQMRERMRDRGGLRRRPQSMFSGYAPGYGNPDYSAGGYPYGDIDIDYQDEYPQYAPYFAMPTRPTRDEAARKQQFQPASRTARSQSRQPMYKRQLSPPQPSSEDNAPKIRIPISSPSDKPKKPEPSAEEKEAAASKIQSAYRIHHALNEIKALREQFDQLVSSFVFPALLDFDPSSQPQGAERPKLIFNKNNAPLHAHEDALLKLLQKLDAVGSYGDRDVRERRRELVREVEKELEGVDVEVRRRYEEVKAKAQPSEARKEEESMEVEPAQRATEPSQQRQPAPVTEKMDEDIQEPVRPSNEGEVIASRPSESQSQPMDVEPSTSSTSTYAGASSFVVPLEQELSAAASETTIEQHPSPTNDLPAESEVETPPQASAALPQPAIHTADPESPPASSSHPVVEPTDVEMQKEPQGSVPSGNASVQEPLAAERHKTHRVTVEEEDAGDDDEEVVIVEDAQPGIGNSPVLAEAEKEFVVV